LRAVILALDGEVECPNWLWPWLEGEVAARKIRVLHLGSLAALELGNGSALARWLARFGLAYDGTVVEAPSLFDVLFADKRSCNYESRQLARRKHLGPHNESPDNKVWVRTVHRRRPNDVRAPVVTGPWGGLALHPWFFSLGGENNDRRWHVDPFEFFSEALGLAGVPAPDPSVVNGRRMFVLHVDGDGFESTSTVSPGQICGKVFLDDVVDRYALPMTVSIIVASLTKDLKVTEPTPEMKIAREIFKRPWIEAASHSVLHPLNWRRKLTRRTPPRTVVWYPGIRNYEHDMVAEVRESIRFINDRLLDGKKRCKVMLWSGAANPTEEAILEAGRAGCWNLNGGVYRWDSWYDSVGFVSPWGVTVGSAFQVYCGAANENVFEGLFSSMPVAFKHINRTLENTGKDRILKPANIYIHFYSVERPARHKAMKAIIERWAFSENTAPVFASDYTKAVHSARFGCVIVRSAHGWLFRDFGHLRTVRIDGETPHVDWRRSRGLIGARRDRGSLFIHLGAPDAELYWSSQELRCPHIEQANHILEDVQLLPGGIRLVSDAYSAREIVLAGFPASSDLDLTLDGSKHELSSDGRGRAQLRFEQPGRTLIEVRTR
ncbi:MAG: hypothetical protein ACE5F1_14730, partial [Planctomycetota bacterium]